MAARRYADPTPAAVARPTLGRRRHGPPYRRPRPARSGVVGIVVDVAILAALVIVATPNTADGWTWYAVALARGGAGAALGAWLAAVAWSTVVDHADRGTPP